VDDETPMVEILSRFMQPIASLIDSTDNLRDGMEMVSKNNYNVVVLDLKLLNTGKEEAFAAIRWMKQFKTAVVVVSGLQEPNLKEDVLAAGADAFVAKDGNFNQRSLLIAANIATLKLPRDSFRSDSFSEHVKMLTNLVNAA